MARRAATRGARLVLAGLAVAVCVAIVASGCGDADGAPAEVKLDGIAQEKTAARKERLIRRKKRQLRRREQASTDAGPTSEAADAGSGLLAGVDSIAEDLGGEVGATVGAPGSGPAATGGSLRTGSAWSTIKVPIALRVLEDAGGPDNLSGSQRGQIERALTLSDNAAAAELFAGLGQAHGGVAGAASAVTGVLRAAGDGTTVVSTQGRDGFSPYGQTEWSLPLQERFMAALAGGCIGDEASRAYVLDLMGRVSSDTWGLGSAGVPASWKGGWGPDPGGGYLVRQMGILEVGGRQLVVTIAARANDGQFASAQALASAVARWIAGNASSAARSESPC